MVSAQQATGLSNDKPAPSSNSDYKPVSFTHIPAIRTAVTVNPAPPVAASPRYRTTSLRELGREKDMKPASLYASQSKDAKSDFSQDDLVKYWIEYANSLTIEKIHLKNTLLNCKPVLKENFSFEISVYNPSQKDGIADSKDYIMGYLSNKLNNNRLKMDVRLVEKGEIEMIYTAAEKYDYLSRKNPNIEKLRELFNLGFE